MASLRTAQALRTFSRSSQTCLYSRPVLPRSTFASRLASTLAILEERNGELQPSALNVITAAKKIGGEVTAFVAGTSAKEVADQAAKVEGVDKVVYVKNGLYDKVRFLSMQARCYIC